MSAFGPVVRHVAMTAAAAAVVLACFSLAYPVHAPNLALLALSACALAAVQMLVVPVPRGRDVELVRLEEAVLVPILLLLPPTEGLIAVAVGVTLGGLLSRAENIKILFNTAQMVLSAAAGRLIVIAAVGATPHLDTAALLAGAAGVGVHAIVNRLLTGKIVSLSGGIPYRTVLLDKLGLMTMIILTATTFGLLLALAVDQAPWLVGVAMFPLLVLHRSHLAYVERAQHSSDLSQLGRHARAMGSATNVRAAAFMLLENARALVGADQARLHIEGDTNTYVADAQGTHVLPAQPDQPPGSRGAELRIAVNGGGGLTAHLVLTTQRSAVAAEAFSERERELVEMLARQAKIGLENAWLLQRVAAERNRLERIFEHSSEGLLVIGSNGRVISWNPALEQLTGFTAEDMLESQIGLLSTELAEIPGHDKPGVVIGTVGTKAGQRRSVQAHFAPTSDPRPLEQEDPLWVVVVHDVTARLEAERLKDDFVATVSHELRTPLTAIKGFIDTMQRTDVSFSKESVPLFLEVMGEQAHRLERLITDLLEIGAIESGRPLQLQLRNVQLGPLVHRTLRGFEAAHPECKVLAPAPGEDLRMWADEHRLEQVLTNLLENARRHGCGPNLRTADISVDWKREGSWVSVSVSDAGRGIAADQQERIFERFYQGSSADRRTGGTGLGLYICKRLVQAMGGTISVTSQPGKGATFTVQLPLATTPPREPQPAAAHELEPQSAASTAAAAEEPDS